MNSASFMSYTPRIIRFEYDILESTMGCQRIPGGVRVSDVLPITTVCVDNHDETNYKFTQPDTVSYSYGPPAFGEGDPANPPFVTGWAYWVSTSGMRVGPFSRVVPPATGLGNASSLYNTTVSTKVTHAFNEEGLLAVAIQKASKIIELKRYITEEEATATITFTGMQPVLWFTGELYRTETSKGQLVVFYLREENLKDVYVRLEEDAFAVEYKLNADLTVTLARLIETRAEEHKLIIYAIDDQGRDVLLKTELYPWEFSDAGTLGAAFQSGFLFEAGIDVGETVFDKSNLACSILRGVVHKSVIDAGDITDVDKCLLGVSILEGEVL